MTCKEEVLYIGVLEHIKERAMAHGEPAPTTLISDYEMAIQNAMAVTFPTGRIQGCHFHFSKIYFCYLDNFLHQYHIFFQQCIYKTACEYGLKLAYHNNALVNKLIKLLIAIAYLDPARAVAGYEVHVQLVTSKEIMQFELLFYRLYEISKFVKPALCL